VQLLLEEQAFDGGHLVLDASLAVFIKKEVVSNFNYSKTVSLYEKAYLLCFIPLNVLVNTSCKG